MDITKFYELKTRLYNTAAAGCMTVSDDFRLKRAVEDFKPLASANKAFEKLYSLCEKLFSEKPESVLPDCIALADALAVTQGTFADNAETKPAAGECVSAQKPASSLAAVKELMRKSGDELWKLSTEYKDTLQDPRIITAFLNDLENGKFNDNFKVFGEIMCEICGRTLVPGLKATVKSSGRQLQYIVRLSGDEENELFRALAQDENSPEKVRLAAVSALSCSPENGSLLAELYNTGKAKVKAAALLAMAEMDAPEAEPIFEKLLENFEKNKKSPVEPIFASSGKSGKNLIEPISASSGKACTEFVRKHLAELPDELKSPLDHALASDIALLANKTELDDLYLKLSTKKHADGFASARCEEALLAGLAGTKFKAVQAQIDRLYEKAPKEFSKLKVFSDIMADPYKEPIVPEDQYNTNGLVHSFTYIPILGKYFVLTSPFYNIYLLPLRPVGERLPDWLIRKICETADNAVKLFNDLQAPTRDEMLKKAKALGFKDTSRTDALAMAFEKISNIVNPLAYCLRLDHLENCAPEDHEPLRQAMLYLAKKCFPIVGGSYFTVIIIDHLPEITPQEHADMLVDYTVNDMVLRDRYETYPVLTTLSARLTDDEMLAALTKLRARVSEWKGRMDDNTVEKELEAIDSYVKQIQSKG